MVVTHKHTHTNRQRNTAVFKYRLQLCINFIDFIAKLMLRYFGYTACWSVYWLRQQFLRAVYFSSQCSHHVNNSKLMNTAPVALYLLACCHGKGANKYFIFCFLFNSFQEYITFFYRRFLIWRNGK